MGAQHTYHTGSIMSNNLKISTLYTISIYYWRLYCISIIHTILVLNKLNKVCLNS